MLCFPWGCMRSVLLLLTTLLAITASSQNVNTRFRIERGGGPITRTGNMGGSCDDIDMDLAAVYRESIDMARVVVAAMDSYTSDATVRASLFTFFGIREDASTHTVSAASNALFSTIKIRYQEVIDDSDEQYEDLLPSLFCSEKWRWRTRWWYNAKTELPDGRLLKEVNGNVDWMHWSPRLRTYSPDIIMCQGNNMAFTAKSSITLCPRMFSYPRRKDTLQPWRSGAKTIEAGINMAVAYSSPAIFLHELMHLVSEREITDEIFEDPTDGVNKTAYGPVLTAMLAQSDGRKAATNADNYAWFAVAMYLNRNDWSRVIEGKRVSGPAVRSSALVADGDRSWRTFLRGKAGNETIDTYGIEMSDDNKSDFPWDG